MITDEEIAEIEAKCRYSPDGKRSVIDKRQRDRAIYQLGRQHQRESDAALCRDAAEKYAERARCKMRTEEVSAALASNAAATCLETAIRNNTGELKWEK